MIPSFPSHNVLVRNVESVHTPIRSFYLSNTLVKAIITHNDFGSPLTAPKSSQNKNQQRVRLPPVFRIDRSEEHRPVLLRIMAK
jgi:hypothetical protein